MFPNNLSSHISHVTFCQFVVNQGLVEMLQDFVFVVAIFVVRVLVQVAAVLLLVLAVVAAVVEFEVVAKNIVLLE